MIRTRVQRMMVASGAIMVTGALLVTSVAGWLTALMYLGGISGATLLAVAAAVWIDRGAL